MNKLVWATLILAACFVGDAYPQQPLVAEQVTKDNAAKRLFAGTDANGGIGDWYISNGIVEAVIDNVAFQDDLVKAANISRPQQNGIAPTGGTLIDLGLVGKNNDQFNSMFQVCNIDPANAFFYTGIKAVNTDNQASIVVDGVVLFTGLSTLPGTGGPGPTLAGQTVFSVAPGDKFITVTSTIINGTGKAAPLFNITDAFPLVGRSTLPFATFPGRGFSAPVLSLTPTGIAAALGLFPYIAFPGNVRPEDGIMDTVTKGSCGEVSYGVAPVSMTIDPDGPTGPMPPTTTPLPVLLGVTSAEVSATGNAFDPTKSPMIPAGGSITFTRRIFVGEKNDVASVSDQMLSRSFPAAALGTLTGDVDASDSADLEASIIISGGLQPFFPATATLPITQVRTDKTGKFSVTLPAGDYTLNIVAPNRDDMNGVKVSVAPGMTNNVAIPRMSAAGSVSFNITEKGQAIPAKLTFIGVEGTPNPDFGRFFDARMFDSMGNTATDLQASAITGTLNFVFATSGSGKQTIKPGKYQVIASRGLEYTISRQTITVSAGQDAKMDFALERVVDTKGFVSADFHVHSGKSFDASVPLEDRIRSFAAENVEVVVSTEHNYIADYSPIVSKLMLNSFMKTIVGDELTTSLPTPLFPQAFGHHIAFPLTEQVGVARRGAPFTEYVPAATFYDRVRMMNPNPSNKQVIQLNHPRAGVAGLTLIGLFNIVNYSPTRPIPVAFTVGSQLTPTTRNIDFDAMELYNGDSIAGYQVTRNDWFGLINQGFIKTATAVSDSHRAVVETPGFPVSFVASPTDDPSAVKDEMVTSAVLARNLVGTSGPFIRFSIQGQAIGSLVKKTSGKVKVDITVSAPAWVPVDEVRLLENGKVVMTFDANSKIKLNPTPTDPTSNQGVERLKVVGLKVKSSKKDSFFTVEAGIKLPLVADLNGDGVIETADTNGDGKVDAMDRGFVQPPSPPIYSQIAPGFTSLGFTNPIFIDRNGNGKFDNAGISASREFITTPDEPIEVETDLVESLSDERHHIRFPWYGLKVGAQEIKLFQEMLDENTTRQFVVPKQSDKDNEK
ncbi:MAG: CehA/McbA family metallohydrolase [Acidobacteria bacterium]|nr:CehA/McbA family metallohydrolase [Acidobacteriota bacterium]